MRIAAVIVAIATGCTKGQQCQIAADCPGRAPDDPGICLNGRCEEQCADGIQDGDETDVDCGGAKCLGCTEGKRCLSATDCTDLAGPNPICLNGHCTNHCRD